MVDAYFRAVCLRKQSKLVEVFFFRLFVIVGDERSPTRFVNVYGFGRVLCFGRR